MLEYVKATKVFLFSRCKHLYVSESLALIKLAEVRIIQFD